MVAERERERQRIIRSARWCRRAAGVVGLAAFVVLVIAAKGHRWTLVTAMGWAASANYLVFWSSGVIIRVLRDDA
jgi:small neutral amino acid transporter SnatA (MarC family)